ncbi:MAG: cobyrinate a,c-diamide synthase [Verrucomicrobiota bacterium]|nr:cobyrinate a,c-diamide synthase [Verrucomicrobiota bacterium]
MTPQDPSPGLILAGLQSSSGKTAVTCLLLSALRERGCAVQPFKVGPDFIDPGYHAHFSGTASRNLDSWLMGEDAIAREVRIHGAGRLSIVEGVMGLFDGSDVHSDEGSTMELARLLDWPLVLVVPGAKAGRSLAAALRGFIDEAGPGRIAGVILNQVSGKSHGDYLREAIAPLKVPVLGAIPISEALSWPERHLGLQASVEKALPSSHDLAALAEQHLDVPGLLAMLRPGPENAFERRQVPPQIRIAVARDEAFHFYYEANLDYLRGHAELLEFSPLHDRALPAPADALLIGGGFPEVFADGLAQNETMRSELRSVLAGGMPCYAECGGLMLLAEELIALDGKRHPMAGAIPGCIEMTPRLSNFGYCECSELAGAEDARFRGHEFHHSRWLAESEHANLWTVRRKRSGTERMEGFTRHRLHASYVHLHFTTSAAALAPLFASASQRDLEPEVIAL